MTRGTSGVLSVQHAARSCRGFHPTEVLALPQASVPRDNDAMTLYTWAMLELPFPATSVEDYLAQEQAGDVRHEYVNGYVYALAGGSSRHNRISLNIAAHLLGLAQGKPCRVYQEGMKLRATADTFYYPDVMVVCGRDAPDPFYENEPCILVEVLSPSTKTTDLREKLTAYKSLPSVQTYLILDAERLAVRHIAKGADGHWLQEDLTGDGDIPLPCLNGILSLPQIYQAVFS